MITYNLIKLVRSALWKGAEIAGNVSGPSYEELVAAKAHFDNLIQRIEMREAEVKAIIDIAHGRTELKEKFLAAIDLAKYDLNPRDPTFYKDAHGYTDALTADILWYAYKWLREEKDND